MQVLKPGDIVHPQDEPGFLRTIVAILECGKIFTADEWTFSIHEDLVVTGEVQNSFKINHTVMIVIKIKCVVAPGIDELSVGDWVLLVDGLEVTPLLVAVVDRPCKSVFSADGVLIPVSDKKIIKSGWRTEEKGLLSPKGERELRRFYQ